MNKIKQVLTMIVIVGGINENAPEDTVRTRNSIIYE